MKLQANKKVIVLSLSLVIASVFLLVHPTLASPNWGLDILSGICSAIVTALGWILIKIMGLLVYFAQYNGFIQSPVVVNGWVIVRDVCNMFFVLILLIIAFATILRIEEYSYKKWLPKLILMAILINFSKTICGLLIDGAQIIMLTFVNSFKDVAGANLTTALGISDWQKIKDDVGGDWEVAAALVLAVIYVIISIVVITAMLAMIAMRIVMLWIYVVLSPAAYLMSAFPAGKKYAGQWWSQFTQNLIVGPVLAFFIWLSFTSLATFNSNDFINASVDKTQDLTSKSSSSTPFGTSNTMIKFIVAIGLLLGGMKITQEIGGVAGSAAGAGMNRINKMGKSAVRGVGGTVAAVTGYNFAKRRYGEFQKKTKEKIQAKSDLVYESVKGGAKGVVKGSANVVGSGVKGAAGWTGGKIKKYAGMADDKLLGGIGGKVGAVVGGAAGETKAWYQRRLDRKKENERRYDARVNNDVYKDKNGKEYKYNDTTKKYENGRGEAAEGVNGEAIKKMSDTSFRFRSGLHDGLNKSEAVRNEQKDKMIGDQQKVLDASGVSTTELKRIMNDSAVNKNRRLAAAMTLAIKNGFKNNDHKAGRQDVNNAKALIGDNQVVLKKFNEAVNKSYAHLNHNLEDEKGRNDFKKGMDEGKFDGYSLDASAYKSSDLIETLKDYSGVDFEDNMKRTSSRSAQHRTNATEGLIEAKNKDLAQNPLWDGVAGKLNGYSKLIATLSGNMKNAFSKADGSYDADSEDATTKFMEMAKPSWLNNFDNDQLKNDGVNDMNVVGAINRAIAKGIQLNTVVSLEKSGSNSDFVRRILGAIKALDPVKQVEVGANPILSKIKVIDPAKPTATP